MNEALVKQVFENNGFTQTNQTQALVEFESDTNDEVIYFVREDDLSERVQVVIHPELDYGPFRDLPGVTIEHPVKYRYSTNQRRYPKVLHKGKNPIPYGVPVFFNSIASLKGFLQTFQQRSSSEDL
jgi:hypothetical protein